MNRLSQEEGLVHAIWIHLNASSSILMTWPCWGDFPGPMLLPCWRPPLHCSMTHQLTGELLLPRPDTSHCTTLHKLYCWWRHQASIADFQLTTDQYSPQLRFDYSSSYRTGGRNCRMRASFTEGLCPPHISWLLPNSIAGSIDHQGHQFDSLLSVQDKPCEKYSTSWRTLREEKKSVLEDRSTRRVM